MGTLTRPQMVEIINRRESVTINGVIYSTVESLPSEVTLAQGDTDRLDAHARALQEQIANNQRELERVRASLGAASHTDEARGSDGGATHSVDSVAAAVVGTRDAIVAEQEPYRVETAARGENTGVDPEELERLVNERIKERDAQADAARKAQEAVAERQAEIERNAKAAEEARGDDGGEAATAKKEAADREAREAREAEANKNASRGKGASGKKED